MAEGPAMYDFSDPSRVGPGAWFLMHVMAANAETREDKEFAIKQIRLLCNFFGCGKCREHCKKYITDYPPEDAIDVENGLFRWSVDFRNAVQRQLGRNNIYDYGIMLTIFTKPPPDVCIGDCDKQKKGNRDIIEVELPEDQFYAARDMYESMISHPSQKKGIPRASNIQSRSSRR